MTTDQELLDSGDFTPCENCNKPIRVDHNGEDLWPGFEEQAEELEDAIGNGPPEWTCSEPCMKARIAAHTQD